MPKARVCQYVLLSDDTECNRPVVDQKHAYYCELHVIESLATSNPHLAWVVSELIKLRSRVSVLQSRDKLGLKYE